MHSVKFNIKTPLDFIKDLRTDTVVEIEHNQYKSTIAIRGEQLIIDLFGNVKVRFTQNVRVDVHDENRFRSFVLNGATLFSAQVEEALLDILISGAIDSHVMKIPKTTIVTKKDFSGDKKQLKFNASMEEPVSEHVGFPIIFYFSYREFNLNNNNNLIFTN